MKRTPKTPITPKKNQKCRYFRGRWPSRIDAYNAFIEWMAYPRSIRKPKTQGAFAVLHEVSPDTLSDYKKKPEFWKKVKENKEELKREIEDSILLAKAMKEIEGLDFS